MTPPNFRMALEKGGYAENIIRGLLEKKGFIVYCPMTDGSHAFDILAIQNKERVIALDVKAKARRTYWPDTGVNQRHFETYVAFSQRHSIDFWIIFVDEYKKEIYGNTLEKLETPRKVGNREYPRIEPTRSGTKIRYWPLEAMIGMGRLPSDAAEILGQSSQRNYEYPKEVCH